MDILIKSNKVNGNSFLDIEFFFENILKLSFVF